MSDRKSLIEQWGFEFHYGVQVSEARGKELAEKFAKQIEQDLLTKLREGVEAMQRWEFDYEQAHPMNTESDISTLADGSYVNYTEILAVIADLKKAGEEK